MGENPSQEFLSLVTARQGHFRLESGHHSQLWFDLDRLFAAPGREGLYRAEYRLPRGLRDRVRGKRVAIVDDVISAGSAVRGTYAELQAHGAQAGVVGALMVLGSLASDFFAQQGVPVTSLAQLPYDLWMPEKCPLCASGLPLEDSAASAPP